jgi:DNA-binding NtrC family response regulator
VGFRGGNPSFLALAHDRAGRAVVATLRRVLPDWQCVPADGGAEVEPGKEVEAFVGILVVPEEVGQAELVWMERAHLAAPEVLWVAVLSPDHLANVPLMKVVTAVCHDFFTTPLEAAADKLRAVLAHAAGFARLRLQLCRHGGDGSEKVDMVARCPAMRRIDALVGKFAAVDAPVMIGGESGAGKELVARAIHRASQRREGPFIAVNCGAIPENLFESELFGHVKGAFTGAVKDRQGKAAIADGGVLFLDEIGDLSLTHQVKILRFLQDGTFEPVGCPHSVRVDVRIIAATHVDLAAAVREQRFREDLFYRLNVLPMRVPPLRERGHDIELLAEHFLAQVRLKTSTKARGFCADARQTLQLHRWPGNVRELINRVSKAAIMAEGPLITPEDLDLPRPLAEARASVINLQEARERAERQAVEQALRDSSFNVSQAANMLGVSRMTIYRLLEKHGITID